MNLLKKCLVIFFLMFSGCVAVPIIPPATRTNVLLTPETHIEYYSYPYIYPYPVYRYYHYKPPIIYSPVNYYPVFPYKPYIYPYPFYKK